MRTALPCESSARESLSPRLITALALRSRHGMGCDRGGSNRCRNALPGASCSHKLGRVERVTATWPDGRSVTYWDGEVSGDAELVRKLDQRDAVDAASPEYNIAPWRRNGYSFRAASTAVRAPYLPRFTSEGV